LRASVVGATRTAEELGRAFPGAVVRISGRGSGVLATVPGGPAVVVATPGAEPVAEGGYGAALLLDSWALLGRADLRAGEETLRRWMNAATLVRAGGPVVVAADAGHAVVQALVRWDPAWLAERELADRRELGFPPATRMASLAGSPAALAEFLEAARLPADADLLGPVPEPPRPGQDAEGERERYLVRVPRGEGLALARALAEVQGVRSAKKVAEHVRVHLDPLDLV
jgi:primosomal protein N' (replication factor Y)